MSEEVSTSPALKFKVYFLICLMQLSQVFRYCTGLNVNCPLFPPFIKPTIFFPVHLK